MKITVIMLTLAVSALHAQNETQVAAMEKLSFLVGRWDGKAVTEFVPGQRSEARQQETVTKKLDGLMLLVEGLGSIEREGKTIVVHEAVATISYDPATSSYRMRSFDRHGRYVDADGKWIEGKFQWGFKTGQGEFRYTIDQTDDGSWHEIGEMSKDGATWRKFLEMNLKRVE